MVPIATPGAHPLFPSPTLPLQNLDALYSDPLVPTGPLDLPLLEVSPLPSPTALVLSLCRSIFHPISTNVHHPHSLSLSLCSALPAAHTFQPSPFLVTPKRTLAAAAEPKHKGDKAAKIEKAVVEEYSPMTTPNTNTVNADLAKLVMVSYI